MLKTQSQPVLISRLHAIAAIRGYRKRNFGNKSIKQAQTKPVEQEEKFQLKTN